MVIFRGQRYKSKKHPILEYIFKKYYKSHLKQEIIAFYLSDISAGYRVCGVKEPVSISNTILDLTRQDRGIESRLPKSIYELGYDLRKKTGQDSSGKKYAGEFVLVGIGNTLKSWLVWPSRMREIIISSSPIPPLVKRIIRPDEGGLFSVIDYTDLFSKVLHKGKRKIYRIQNPMKWQPNEIDGLYASQQGTAIELYPVEVKALTTGDEINLDQMNGGYTTVDKQMKKLRMNVSIQPIAVKMIRSGLDIAVFRKNRPPVTPVVYIRVKFNPKIKNWK